MTSLLKNKRFYLKSIILLFVAGVLSACNKQQIYHTFQSLPTAGWQRKDTLRFNVEVTDSLTYYKLSVEIRNRNSYPYQNINLSVCYDNPDKHTSPADSLQFTLANEEGVWKGDGWGGLYQTSFPAGNIRIGKAGIYRFKIAYTLPDEKLKGINDIGIKLEKP
ncbi:gliding motility lipoprotein GldH [Bacteroides helcogenes]|uniref:Gliding motility-associated lipoprotein GldH n=1 Tax=Bacteroides helcogenes (strain ATCC 35417 / DSM 20613 / JCM 6297 / CCUG 15421 / P 36-108) TaxID=693979 RepID=E6SSP8_BACT6|nr:gliding motility lipoprotein GldH [Bacteroides helcogenes]ADV43161.1 gliding motility-associated lipoprotein GldH [Bacteroides helcogenes P 36-108]MDY5239139.1 gliding motility lipoprotein GldH [Bacteroides helcogenes]